MLEVTENGSLENRKLFVRNLGELLSQTRENIVGAELDDNETVSVTYREVADGYRQQANSTAAEYNNYILKNSYVFSGNIPSDIFGSLEMIK